MAIVLIVIVCVAILAVAGGTIYGMGLIFFGGRKRR